MTSRVWIFVIFGMIVLASATASPAAHPAFSSTCEARQAAAELSAAASALTADGDTGQAFLRTFWKHEASLELPIGAGMTSDLKSVAAQFVSAQQLLAELIAAERLGDARQLIRVPEIERALTFFPVLLHRACQSAGQAKGSEFPRLEPAVSQLSAKTATPKQADAPHWASPLLAAFMLLMCIAALFAISRLAPDRRSELRRPCNVESFLVYGGRTISARIRDINPAGAMIEGEFGALNEGDRVELGVGDATQRSVVVWKTRFCAGLKFKNRISEASIAAVIAEEPYRQTLAELRAACAVR